MTQPQREALLDLLILSTFVDSHLSLLEDEALQTAIEAVGWESTKPRDIYVLTAISKARIAADTEEGIAAFITAKTSVFADAGARQEALTAVRGVLVNDGLADAEAGFLKRLEQALA